MIETPRCCAGVGSARTGIALQSRMFASRQGEAGKGSRIQDTTVQDCTASQIATAEIHSQIVFAGDGAHPHLPGAQTSPIDSSACGLWLGKLKLLQPGSTRSDSSSGMS